MVTIMADQTVLSDRSRSIIFVGRLRELPSDAPRCGDLKVAVAYKFEVERLLLGQAKNKTIIVLIACPDLKGEAYFEINASYRIEASANLEDAASYSVYNDYPKRVAYWVIDISK